MLGTQFAQRIAADDRFEWLGTDRDRATGRWRGPSRLLWWPRGVPGGIWRAIVSSRLPRALDRLPALFDHLRASLAELQRSANRVVLVVPSAAAAAAVERGTRRAGRPRILVSLPAANETSEAWLAACAGDEPCTTGDFPVHVSPPILECFNEPEPPWPLADRILAALADEVDALSVRSGGVWRQLLVDLLSSRRLESDVGDQAPEARRSAILSAARRERPIRVAADPTLVSRSLLEQFAALGGQLWQVPPGRARRSGLEVERDIQLPSGADGDSRDDFESSEALAALGPYLIHATRRCDGPWPGQESDAYWDELLDGSSASDRSPLATLAHLLEEGRIRGSSRGIRGGVAVVCWAEINEREWAARRVWRKHRRRWDFEPFGVAVARDWLERQGARRVIYGDERKWDELTAGERPFFQRANSGTGAATGRSAASIDWEAEREWRSLGDFDLRGVPPGKLVVLAGDVAAARWLRSRVAWPVVVIGESSRASG